MRSRPHLVAPPARKTTERLAAGRLMRSDHPAALREPAPASEIRPERALPRPWASHALLLLAVVCEVAAFLLIVSIADRGLSGIWESAWPLTLLGFAAMVCSWLGHGALRHEREPGSASSPSTGPGTDPH